MNALLAAVVTLAGIGVAAARVTPDVQQREIAARDARGRGGMAAQPTTRRRASSTSTPGAATSAGAAGGTRLHRRALRHLRRRPIRAYARAISLADDPGPLLAAASVDAVVFWPTSGFAGWLDAHGWRRVHADAVAVIWMR